MKIKATWHGGYGYGAPCPELNPEDVESFDSIKAAKWEFYRRLHNQGTPATPCVEENAEMLLYLGGDYTPNGPDRIISIGPRGGIKVERC